jgi:type IV fimbrial biogenesis protein FimT
MNLMIIQPRNSTRKLRGFTMIELIITMSVAAILVAIAAPAFVSSAQGARRRAEVGDLVVALTSARSEAVKQNTATGVSVTANGSWGQGWTVCCTLAGAQVTSARALDSRSSMSAVQVTTTPVSITFIGSGAQLKATLGTLLFTFCDARGAAAASAVEVNPSGQIQGGAKPGFRADQTTPLTCGGG